MWKNVARRFLIALSNRSSGNRIDCAAIINPRTTLEGMNTVHAGSVISNSRIGFGTFIGQNCTLYNASLGRYCSIGPGVKVVASTHPARRFVSTHPAFYSVLKQAGFTYVKDQRFQEQLLIRGRTICIGNDVWIGEDVTILGGLNIADGAIIATGSVVTRDIPPYAICGGVPARVIRMRFTPSEIAHLIGIQWWNWDQKRIEASAHLFEDIQTFLAHEAKS